MNTDEVNNICIKLRIGVPIETACDLCGVPYDQVRDLLRQARKDAESGEMTAAVEVNQRLAYAEAEHELQLIEQLGLLSKRGTAPGALKYFLEQRYPKHWGPKAPIPPELDAEEISRKIAHAIGAPIMGITDDFDDE